MKYKHLVPTVCDVYILPEYDVQEIGNDFFFNAQLCTKTFSGSVECLKLTKV